MKRLYGLLAGLSVAQLLVLSGFLITLAMRGALAPQRVEGALRALRGDMQNSPGAASQPASAPASEPSEPPTVREQIADDEDAVRIRRTELDRRERELADQWDLLKSAQLEHLRERESFAKEKADWEAALKKQAEELALSGATKELEYLSIIKADMAKDMLRQKKEPDVVALLLQIETRTGRKIIESCKTDEERLWIGRIMEQLRQRNNHQAEALKTGQP